MPHQRYVNGTYALAGWDLGEVGDIVVGEVNSLLLQHGIRVMDLGLIGQVECPELNHKQDAVDDLLRRPGCVLCKREYDIIRSFALRGRATYTRRDELDELIQEPKLSDNNVDFKPAGLGQHFQKLINRIRMHVNTNVLAYSDGANGDVCVVRANLLKDHLDRAVSRVTLSRDSVAEQFDILCA